MQTYKNLIINTLHFSLFLIEEEIDISMHTYKRLQSDHLKSSNTSFSSSTVNQTAAEIHGDDEEQADVIKEKPE